MTREDIHAHRAATTTAFRLDIGVLRPNAITAIVTMAQRSRASRAHWKFLSSLVSLVAYLCLAVLSGAPQGRLGADAAAFNPTGADTDSVRATSIHRSLSVAGSSGSFSLAGSGGASNARGRISRSE